jgi:hypothetical protein
MQDFDITGSGDVCYSRPQLFFKCTLCSTGEMDIPCRHKEYSLGFSSTFEPISLTPDSCMQRKGVPMLYKRLVTVLPTLYVWPVENTGSSAIDSMILEWQHKQYNTAQVQGSYTCKSSADSRLYSGAGSRLFKINIWMWRYWQKFPREIAVANSVELCKKQLSDSRIRAAATMHMLFSEPRTMIDCGSEAGVMNFIAPHVVPNVMYDIIHDIDYNIGTQCSTS